MLKALVMLAIVSAMARMIVAKRKRLRIVGAVRNGPTAISHQHGKVVDLT